MIVTRDRRQLSRPTPPPQVAVDKFGVTLVAWPFASAVADFSYNLISSGEVMSM